MADEVDEVGERTPRWGVGDAVVGWFLGLVVSAVVLGVANPSGDTTISPPIVAVTQLGLWVGIVGVPVWASRAKGNGSLARDFGLRMEPKDPLVGIPIGVVSQLLLVPLLFLPIRWLSGERDLSKPAKQLIGTASGAPEFILLVVVLAVGAPIAEELFFRGLLLRALQRRFQGSRHTDVWAVGISAVAFGLVHFEPLQLAPLVLFGVILGVMAVRYDRLGPAIWAHATFNLLAVVFLS